MSEWFGLLSNCLNRNQCTPEDRAQIEALNSICNGSYSGRQCPSDTTPQQRERLQSYGNTTGKDPDQALGATCSGTNALFDIVCWGRTIGTVVGNLLIASTAWLLAVMGLIFNWLVEQTVVKFGSFYAIAKTGIELAWTVFRDIANILIIGLFTFIAISIIIGQQQFGQKKMIARVLIVAVLINFSLLFTKIIIDGSNFLAMQFYRAAALPASSSAATGINFDDYSQSGISGRFINLMGLTSVIDTGNALKKASFGTAENNFTDAQGIRTFVHALFSATVLFAAAIVFGYGAYLLTARAILLIFLLLTSALAFASYLIPQLSTEGAGEQYGWKAWWNALLRAAVFGPLLMMFLWAVITVGEALKVSNGTLGDLITNPTKSTNLAAIFSYLIILGLLFASIRLASSFSTTIGGFGVAQSAVGLAAFTPVAALSRLGGWFGRTQIGARAGNNLTAMQESIARRVATGGSEASWGERLKMKQMAKLSKSSFDALNVKGINEAFKKAGASTLEPLLGKEPGKGGIVGVRKRQAGEAAEGVADIAMSKKQMEKTVESIVESQKETQKAVREAALASKEQHEATLQTVQTVRADAETAKRTEQTSQRDQLTQEITRLTETIDNAEAGRRERQDDFDSRIRVAEQRAANISDSNSAEAQQAQAEVARIRAERSRALNEEEQRIRTAQADVVQRRQVLQQLDTDVVTAGETAARQVAEPAQQGIREADKQVRGLDRELRDTETRAKAGAASLGQQRLAERSALNRIDTGFGLFAGSAENDPVASKVSSAISDKHKKEDLKALAKLVAGDDQPTPAPSTPHTPPRPTPSRGTPPTPPAAPPTLH